MMSNEGRDAKKLKTVEEFTPEFTIRATEILPGEKKTKETMLKSTSQQKSSKIQKPQTKNTTKTKGQKKTQKAKA